VQVKIDTEAKERKMKEGKPAGGRGRRKEKKYMPGAGSEQNYVCRESKRHMYI